MAFIAITNTNLSSHALPQLQTSSNFGQGFGFTKRCSYLLRSNKLLGKKAFPKVSAVSSSPSSSAMTLYDVLCVPRSAGLSELKKAYREKARVYHPDVCPPTEREESCKMFIRVQEAYEILSDPLLRAHYDYDLSVSSLMALERVRNGRERKTWAEQLDGLSTRSRSGRDSWGDTMRRFREAATHGIS